MTAYRLARKVRPKRSNAALQSLKRNPPFPADCALPCRVWDALSPIETYLSEYQWRGCRRYRGKIPNRSPIAQLKYIMWRRLANVISR
jgi:hypothetical protein